MFDINIVNGIGNKSAISTSKIMKITGIKKNRDENDSCVEFFGGVKSTFEWRSFFLFLIDFLWD
jgi:hypothetical protein